MSSSNAKSRYDILNEFFSYKMLDFHTQLPATITAVNSRSIDCLPLVKTKYSDGRQLAYEELFDVPLLVLSANKGKTAIKMPVKVGDIVLVFFSERELGDFDTSNGVASDSDSLDTHGLFPVGAFPCIFTSAVGEDIDPNNIIIQNETSSLEIEPNGKITATTQSEYIVNASKATFNCPVEVTGSVDITGVTNMNGGAVVTGGITDDGVDIGSAHTHGGVQSGTDSTGAPN